MVKLIFDSTSKMRNYLHLSNCYMFIHFVPYKNVNGLLFLFYFHNKYFINNIIAIVSSKGKNWDIRVRKIIIGQRGSRCKTM